MLPLFLRRLPLFVLAALSLFSRPAFAATLTVPAQYPTIQAAVNASANGDTVLIADGTYTGPGNVDIDFNGKNITVTSQHGAASTIIDCGGSTSVNHRGFYLHSGETNVVISGFTIQNGYEGGNSGSGSNGGFGSGIYSYSSGLTVQNCIIRNNTASYGSGGGIYSSTQGGSAAIINCVLTGNTADYNGGGIFSNCYPAGTITVTNCTLTGNTASRSATGGGIYSTGETYPPSSSTVTLTNDILYGDTGGEIDYNTGYPPGTALGPIVSYCDIQGGYAGTGNINADPLFVFPPFMGVAPNLHLQPGSPCLGAGTAAGAPATAIDGAMRPNPPSIGAYEEYLAPTAVVVTNATGTAGQTAILRAALGNPGAAGLAGSRLAFSVDGIAAGTAVTGSGGAASLPFAIPAGFSAGSHTITVVFAGDAANAASSGSSTLTVTVPASTAATQVRFFPRTGYEYRMTGGKFQGSTDGTTYTDLYTITQTPARGQYTTVTFAQPAAYRYLRYLSPNNGYGNVAEVSFYSGSGASAVKLTGTLFGTPGSYANSGNDFTKVFDGNPATFFDAPTGSGDFAGVDQGAP